MDFGEDVGVVRVKKHYWLEHKTWFEHKTLPQALSLMYQWNIQTT